MQKGILSIIVLLSIGISSCSNSESKSLENIDQMAYYTNNKEIRSKTEKSETTMEHLTKETFQEKVFNYEKNKEWQYEGDVPCIIDFYADWCGPCKMIAPILEELSKEYEGKIKIYKVDTEKEQELAAVFGIRSIPSILFVPKKGEPQMAMGALPKQSLEKAINEILLTEAEEVK
ncbi:MAG: thioredoxin [Cyclobacteriaceae bacterium]